MKTRRSTIAEFVGGMAILAFLAFSDGSRIYHAVRAGGATPLIISGAAAAGTILAIVIVFRQWKRISFTARRLSILLAVAWFVSMLVLFVATHRMRGFRVVYKAPTELESFWSIAAVGYQSLVWASFFLLTATFMIRYLRRHG